MSDKELDDTLNSLSETTICGNYHDKIEPVPAVDLDGNPIYYKSGIQKGKRKQMCSQAQKTRNVQLFNEGKINILSTNGAPDKDLNININNDNETENENINNNIFTPNEEEQYVTYRVYKVTDSDTIDSILTKYNHKLQSLTLCPVRCSGGCGPCCIPRSSSGGPAEPSRLSLKTALPSVSSEAAPPSCTGRSSES